MVALLLNPIVVRFDRWLGLALVGVCLLITGCPTSSPPGGSADVDDVGQADGDKDAGQGDGGTADAGDHGGQAESSNQEKPEWKGAPGAPWLEAFDPPALADLEASVEWEEQPVRDSMQMLREYQKQNPPIATVAEALELKNDGPEANAKILSALGRLPEDDSKVDWGARMVRWLPIEVKSVNPLLASSVAEGDVQSLTGTGLFGFDWNMQPFAAKDAVRSWHSSKDRMYDKVVMRDDMTWSDGHPFTAHDVVFSFQTIMNPDVPVPAARSGTEQLRWVHAYDDYTLVFFHKKPLATNVGNISFAIAPKHIYAESVKDDPTLSKSERHIELEKKPIVGGSYELVERSREQQIVFRRRESYYMHNGQQVRDKPYFEEIRFKIITDPNTALLAVKQGDIDDFEMQSPELWISQTNGKDFYKHNTKATGEEWTYFYFGWNNDSPLFSDPRVRKAMSYAVDYRELIDNLCYGLFQQSNGIFHPNSWMAPKKRLVPYVYDLDKAEALLEEAGWTDTDGDGLRDKEIAGERVQFSFSLMVRQDPLRVRICELLRSTLDRIGIECKISSMEATVLQQRMLDKDFQAAFAGWGTGSDPDTSENVWKSGEMRNFVSYSNKKVDELFDQGKTEFDREKRAEIYAHIAELIYEDQPVTFLYYMNAFYGFNKELRGYKFSPRGPYHYSPGFGSVWRVVD